MGSFSHRNQQIASTILDQIGLLSRGCLDMKGGKCYIIDSGVFAQNVLVSTAPNRRGNIDIVLTAYDDYTITFARNSDGATARYEHMQVAEMHSLFQQISGAGPDQGLRDLHAKKFNNQ